MKNIITKLMVIFMVTMAANSAEFKIDEKGNLSSITPESKINGSYYSATIHFQSKGSLFYSGEVQIEDEDYFFITDGEESFLIPSGKYSQVYWKYEISKSELSTIIEDDVDFLISLVNAIEYGEEYKSDTSYIFEENYTKGLQRGERAILVSSL